jgi:Coiled-coil domain-containing protein 124 /Oxs1
LPEIEIEHPGLRKKQREDICRKEFEKSEENPFNQAGIVGYDAGKEEVTEHKRKVREAVEGRLAEK